MNMQKIVFIISFIFVLAIGASARTPKSNWAKYDGGKVHYYDIGNHKLKNALVLIHGWNCSADFWKDSYSAFPNYRVIAIDLPGYGQSDKPKANYTMEYFARSIDAVMTKAKVQKAVLAGHSMGTPVVRQFYRIFPNKTLGLIVVDGALMPFMSSADAGKFFGPLLADYKNSSSTFIDGLLKPTRDDLKPAIRSTMLAAQDYVAVSAMKGMLDDSIWTNDKINVPVLAVMAADGPWPKNNEETYRGIAPNLEYLGLHGVSHFLFMEKPKEFNEAVANFVSKNKLL